MESTWDSAYIFKIMKILLSILLLTILSSCTNFIKPDEESESVRIFFTKNMLETTTVKDLEKHCAFKGEIIGSEGNWYSYLFMSNVDLTQGALNDVKNKAAAQGSNIVIIHQVGDFISSVTFVGQSYFCEI
jgi:hypothetical protein